MAKRLEKDIKASIRRFLNKIDNGFFFSYSPGLGGMSGIPDFIGAIDGQAIGIEVKSSTGKISKLQSLTMSNMIVAGRWVCFVARSVQDVKEHFQANQIEYTTQGKKQ